MKTLVLNLFLWVQLIVAPLSLADLLNEFWLDLRHDIEQSGQIETGLPCAEMTSETVESIQKNAYSRVKLEQQESSELPENHTRYEFLIDHHKCDWIIRSSEPDPCLLGPFRSI